MAAAGAEVVHTGNTPEEIAEYKIIYDYSQVGHRLEKEAEMWFGYHTRPRIKFQASEYHYWRKWNDPRYIYGTRQAYVVQLGKCPILVKATGELALSPTVLKQTYRGDGETDIEAIFKRLRKVFADEMKPVVEADVEAGVDVEPVVEPDAGVDVEPLVAELAELALMEKEKQKKG